MLKALPHHFDTWFAIVVAALEAAQSRNPTHGIPASWVA